MNWVAIMRIERIRNATLYCADCREVLPTLGKIDAVVTDPPYGLTNCTWDQAPKLQEFWNSIMWDSAVILFAAQPFATDLIQSNRNRFKYDLIWRKSNVTGFLKAKNAPLRQHEHILVFDHGGLKYNPQMFLKARPRPAQKAVGAGIYRKFQEGVFRTEPDENGFPRSVLDFNTAYHEGNAGLHPTQKPEGLICYLVNTYSDQGDCILDPFMGSGTTGVAAIKLGRRFIGIEIEERYFSIACRRIEEATKQGDLFIEQSAPVTRQPDLFIEQAKPEQLGLLP